MSSGTFSPEFTLATRFPFGARRPLLQPALHLSAHGQEHQGSACTHGASANALQDQLSLARPGAHLGPSQLASGGHRGPLTYLVINFPYHL